MKSPRFKVQSSKLADGQDETQKLQEKILELDGNWKRALADYKNLEFRTEKSVRDALIFGNKNLISRLLKILNDLGLAVEHHPDQIWAKSTRDEMKAILADEGMTEIEALGKPFNPNEMECIGKSDGDEDIVVKIVQTGYKIHDQVLRPVRVEVGKGKNV